MRKLSVPRPARMGNFGSSQWFFVVQLLVSLVAHPGYPQIKVYPNPAESSITIEIPENLQTSDSVEILLLNQTGKKMVQIRSVNHFPVDLNISSMPTGVYTLVLESGEQRFFEIVIKIE
jgi:hypothetical protein